jgi:hypothetical protein
MSENQESDVHQVTAQESDVVTCTGCGEVIWSPNRERPGCVHTLLLTHADGDEPFRCAPELFARALTMSGGDVPEDAEDIVAELRADEGWDAPADWIIEHEAILSRAVDEVLAGGTLFEVHISGEDEHTLWQTVGVQVVEGEANGVTEEEGLASAPDDEDE